MDMRIPPLNIKILLESNPLKSRILVLVWRSAFSRMRRIHGVSIHVVRASPGLSRSARQGTPNLPTNIVDFRGFDSIIILILRGGILTSIGNFPESLSQAVLVGVILVGGLGVRLLLRPFFKCLAAAVPRNICLVTYVDIEVCYILMYYITYNSVLYYITLNYIISHCPCREVRE